MTHIGTVYKLCLFYLAKTEKTWGLVAIFETLCYNENKYDNRMVSEFIEFINAIKNHDLDMCYKMLEHSLIVSEVQTTARKKAGIVFKADIN